MFNRRNLLLARKLTTQRHFSTIPVRSPFRIGLRHDEGSKFPQIDLFKHVYVHPNNENSDPLYGDMVEKSTAILQEATSQLPPKTPIEDVIVPKDADVQIVTEVLDQKFGRRQVAAQGDHIRAQDERMNMIVQALVMSGL
ncbi:hypothetical protein C1H46_034409 [Malus baccata]|uniref:Uncharacterized protein n=1 Tax=Malus baccata TaxID=106549 RepID=A0A540L0M8_MALBA|nr:hypothetical protein C1H46_034409 [Malus baccata]